MEDRQSELVYYVLEEWDALFAYGDCYEFFERYDKEADVWRPSEISYSQFLHDFNGKVIGESEASIIAGGNLPYKKYEEYCRMIKRCSESVKGKK